MPNGANHEELSFSLEDAAGEVVNYRDSWRIFRIVSEIVEGYQFLQGLKKEVTILGSARLPSNNKYYRVARDLGKLLAKGGFPVITGGGPGIMEAGNRGAFEAGGKSIGLNIQLPMEQRVNPFVKESAGFHYFFTRKIMLTAPANAFFFFPGGFGTLDEFFEVVDYMELGLMDRSPIILVGRHFWQPVVNFLREKCCAIGAVDPKEMDNWHIVDTAEEGYELVKHVDERVETCTRDSTSPFCQIGSEWNIFRIMAEMVNGFEFLTRLHREVTVFATQSGHVASPYMKSAYTIGKLLANAGATVINGGGPGEQEALCQGVHDMGGRSIGFAMKIHGKERLNPFLTNSMSFFFPFIRKLIITSPARSFLFMPGGFGTLHHLFEILTLQQTKKMPHTPTVLYDKAFWGDMVEFFHTMADDFKTINHDDLKLYTVTETPEKAVAALDIK
jgi:uncharacterized protein (TIGR00730 family)